MSQDDYEDNDYQQAVLQYPPLGHSDYDLDFTRQLSRVATVNRKINQPMLDIIDAITYNNYFNSFEEKKDPFSMI